MSSMSEFNLTKTLLTLNIFTAYIKLYACMPMPFQILPFTVTLSIALKVLTGSYFTRYFHC